MEKNGGKRQRLRDMLNLPCEPVGKQLLTEILGTDRVIIENHRGVPVFSGEEVYVNAGLYDVHIVGEGLSLAMMSDCSLVICGKIHSVQFEGGGR